MAVSPKDAKRLITMAANLGITTMLHGHPGIGKSDIIKAIAKDFKLMLIDIRMSTYDPVDLNGFPNIVNGVAKYIPFDTFPLADRDTVPDGYNGWLIFLDEFNSAPRSVQAACYRLILDREVGQHALHPQVAIICAGNLVDSGAIVNNVGTAMKSRMAHLELAVVPKEWIRWGGANDIDHRLLAYIGHRPENLYDFKPAEDSFTFACPRTWHFVSKTIKNIPTSDLMDLEPLLSGMVTSGKAREFIAFTEIYAHLTSYADILKNPLGTAISNEPAMLFATAQMIASYLEKKDLNIIMPFIERLPVEFQVLTLQGAVQRDVSLIKESSIITFMGIQGADIFS